MSGITVYEFKDKRHSIVRKSKSCGNDVYLIKGPVFWFIGKMMCKKIVIIEAFPRECEAVRRFEERASWK